MPVPAAIKTAYAELCELPADADAASLRQRGYRLEALICDLLRADDLDSRTSYRIKGEQIDGSFSLDGKIFLIEAKWHRDQLPASALYEFKGKIDGKLVGTVGIFLSMSGYSSDAIDVLGLGKSLKRADKFWTTAVRRRSDRR
jgi:hypothetical protein